MPVSPIQSSAFPPIKLLFFFFFVILDAARLSSYVTPNNTLVIEAPIQNPENERRLTQVKNDQQSLVPFGQYRDSSFDYAGFSGGSDFQSRLVVTGNNIKQLEITVPMKGFKPEEIKVSVKDNDLFVQGEHEYKNGKRSERSSVIKSTTLPPGIQVDQLQSRLGDDGVLKIEVPYTIWSEDVIATRNLHESLQTGLSRSWDTRRKLEIYVSVVFDRFYFVIAVK